MSDLLQEHRPRDVDNLFRTLSKLYGDGRLVFRGQGNKNWKLVSSFDRLHSGTLVCRETDFEHLLIQYRKLVERHYDIRISADGNDIASLGQHFGLPTRLLDWSFSPFIGLFFCIDETSFSLKQDSAIYALDRSLLENKVSRNLFEFIDPDTRYNSNLIRQQGCLSRIKTHHNHLVECFDSMKDQLPDDFSVQKFIVKNKWMTEIWKRLNAMNLNHISLFDSKESVSKKLKTDIILSVLPYDE